MLQSRISGSEILLYFSVFVLVSMSTFVLRSIAPSIYPSYSIYLVLALGAFVFFRKIDFETLTFFSPHFYILSLILLVAPLVIGQVTRGAIRWIPLGSVSIQPSEIMRPFLIMFIAKYLTEKELSPKRLLRALVFLFMPFLLILIQPSLGVAILTMIGFIGTLLASTIKKKYFLVGIGLFLLMIPMLWLVLAPYQKSRITTFIDPFSDPSGAGYNSIQAMISVGSGRFFGRGLGKGVQTQLAFLPERHTDFIFASIAEELGMLGSLITLMGLFMLFYSLVKVVERPKSPTARAFASGVFLLLFVETMIHIGMNMGLVPITGVPLPFVSAGGSALLGTSISLAIALGSRKTS